MDSRKIVIVDSEVDVIKNLCATIEEIADKSIKDHGRFRVGLSSGSLVGFLSKGLSNIKTDWSNWVLAFCDERVVPFDNQDSTYGVYVAALCENGPLKKEQFVIIDPSLDVAAAAKDYASKLAEVFPSSDLPQFDALLLGMGPDGHTCSLFPDHPGLQVTDLWVAPIENSPKPPPNRVTLTFPVINNARNCIFALTGQGKAEMVKKILKNNENLPAGMVLPREGEVLWILDKPAASLL
uniref:6-phosphogluconolactonase n=1 Tax=Lygus hesperus TaxID=30085 RepID=A0A0K8SQJ7_LYGHE